MLCFASDTEFCIRFFIPNLTQTRMEWTRIISNNNYLMRQWKKCRQINSFVWMVSLKICLLFSTYSSSIIISYIDMKKLNKHKGRKKCKYVNGKWCRRNTPWNINGKRFIYWLELWKNELDRDTRDERRESEWRNRTD